MTVSVRRLARDFTVMESGEAPSVSDSRQERIDSLWSQLVRERPTLFEGRVFSPRRCVVGADGAVERIEGSFVPYSRYLSCRVDRELADMLDLWTLGVTGLLWCRDGVVLGVRSATTTDAGRLELVPSGTVPSAGGL